MNKNTAVQIFYKLIELTKDYQNTHKETPLGFVLVMPDDSVLSVPPSPDLTHREAIGAVRSMSETMRARYVLASGETRMIVPGEEGSDTATVTIDGPDLQFMATIEIMRDAGTARITVEQGRGLWEETVN
jgi:hypothetical protein